MTRHDGPRRRLRRRIGVLGVALFLLATATVASAKPPEPPPLPDPPPYPPPTYETAEFTGYHLQGFWNWFWESGDQFQEELSIAAFDGEFLFESGTTEGEDAAVRSLEVVTKAKPPKPPEDSPPSGDLTTDQLVTLWWTGGTPYAHCSWTDDVPITVWVLAGDAFTGEHTPVFRVDDSAYPLLTGSVDAVVPMTGWTYTIDCSQADEPVVGDVEAITGTVGIHGSFEFEPCGKNPERVTEWAVCCFEGSVEMQTSFDTLDHGYGFTGSFTTTTPDGTEVPAEWLLRKVENYPTYYGIQSFSHSQLSARHQSSPVPPTATSRPDPPLI